MNLFLLLSCKRFTAPDHMMLLQSIDGLLEKSQVALVFFLPLGLSYGPFRRFLHGLFSLYKTNRAVRQNVLWEACCRLRQGYTVATGAKQYHLINTTWPLNIPEEQHLFSLSFCKASLSKQQRCREIDLNATLLVQVLVRFNLPTSSLAWVFSRGTGSGNGQMTHPSPGSVTEWAAGRSGLKTLFWFSWAELL